MPISWNEIRSRALKFSNEWATETSEDAEAKSFLDAFFDVFGVTRRRVASFEKRVVKGDGRDGYIDLLWKGVLLVEQKSRGKDLDRAYRQATGYFPGLKERDLPRYILVCDFDRFRLHDLDSDATYEFQLPELHKNIRLFGFLAGYQTQAIRAEDPANIKAAERMGVLHDQLKVAGYDGHVLEVYLVRLLFCLFAEDTSIFELGQFREFIEQKTAEDGSDLGDRLNSLFWTLNTPEERRQRTLDEHLSAFPYVNGNLFAEPLPPAAFDAAMRQILLNCCGMDWSRISPAIFGSLFQSVLDPVARRNLGAHYTREQNILKVVNSLFMDRLRADYLQAKKNVRSLHQFHMQLAKLKFLDPACGCGNFLVIAYRELRQLELDILRELYKNRESAFLDVGGIVQIDVDQFYGIEYEEFPAQIAQVALWLTDHQENMRISEEFGQYFRRLPLKKSAHIRHANALDFDWNELIPASQLTYILGNPPFVGGKNMNAEQRADMSRTFAGVPGAGVLDYVAAWYLRAAQLIQGTQIEVGFVSTSSICQGEQPGILWPKLLDDYKIQIRFAHRPFKWSSESRGGAAVSCVIIGFGLATPTTRVIFEYATPDAEPAAKYAANINPYLADATNVVLKSRTRPLAQGVPEIGIGNKPIDGGQYLFSADARDEFIEIEPESKKWFRPWLGADEFLYGYRRYCLWLGDCPPNELRAMPEAMKRVAAVKQQRLNSPSPPTQRLAAKPTRFHVENIPTQTYVVVPKTSSERRNYIPMGFIEPETLASDLVFIIPNATLAEFGVLSSKMHMAWIEYVCGRLENRYRYSKDIVYNNFPWPELTTRQATGIAKAAQAILDTRARHTTSTLADLYDPVAIPADLAKAHSTLDRLVDRAYGKTFGTDADRIKELFMQYSEMV